MAARSIAPPPGARNPPSRSPSLDPWKRARERAAPGRGWGSGAGGGSGWAGSKAEPGPRASAPRDQSRQEAGYVGRGLGVSPWGAVVDSAQAKRFRLSQLEVRG